MTRGLGPSNDAGCAAEIRAAQLAVDFSDLLVGERWGWDIHEGERWGWASPLGDYWMTAPVVVAGFLARELVTHDDRETRDLSAWPWDPSRPIAGQYEEWLAEVGPPTDPATKFGERAAQLVVAVERAEADR